MRDKIGLVIVFLAIIISLSTAFMIELQFRDAKILKLKDDLEVANNIAAEYITENEILANEVVLRQDITSLIVDAARSYNLDPMLLARLIKSESNFRPNPKHATPNIVGPAGINTKAWKSTKHNPHSYVGNIYTSAEILSHYVEDSDSLTLALTRYKGLSPLGFSQAKQIVRETEK